MPLPFPIKNKPFFNFNVLSLYEIRVFWFCIFYGNLYFLLVIIIIIIIIIILFIYLFLGVGGGWGMLVVNLFLNGKYTPNKTQLFSPEN